MKKLLKAIDLFCGAGGLTQGLRQAGYRVVAAVDIDPLACKAYSLNHKRVKVWQTDISLLSGAAIMKEARLRPGDLDLLTACPPCQGFSTIRTKNGSKRNNDPRNDLIHEVTRLVRSIRPKVIMLENVPRLARSKRFREFYKALESLGYQVQWRVLDSVDFAVPQRRRRLVLLASSLGSPQFPRSALAHRSVRQSIGSLPPPTRSRDPLHKAMANHSKKVRDIIRRIPRDGGSRTALDVGDQLTCHKRVDGFKDIYGRMAWDKPAPTITGGCINPSKGRFLHPRANRAITLREAALLQSFPKAYRFPLDRGRYSVALLIGNALPPEFIRRIALVIHSTTLAHHAMSKRFGQH